ncbi:uncharacterized protein LOC111081592 [Drosophila obscura]|uniref:uncharacterized protein LOC111081592 n=1 Tax=Drosophila obscura TaxID=7282 RepID=UPI001BB22713|nr:uncharacterized protein LOC111081592 [Drosophila obscura]
MRFYLALLNVLAFCTITINGHEACPGSHGPLCGKNGTCYITFANECIRNLFNRQQTANSLKTFQVVQRTACTPHKKPLCRFRQMTNWSFSENIKGMSTKKPENNLNH